MVIVKGAEPVLGCIFSSLRTVYSEWIILPFLEDHNSLFCCHHTRGKVSIARAGYKSFYPGRLILL